MKRVSKVFFKNGSSQIDFCAQWKPGSPSSGAGWLLGCQMDEV